MYNTPYTCSPALGYTTPTAMDDRTCDKCRAIFPNPSKLKRHLLRKTPCQPIVNAVDIEVSDIDKKFQCRFCMRRFASSSSVNKHIRMSCKIARNPDGMELLFRHTLERERERRERAEERTRLAEERVSELEAQLGQLKVGSADLALKRTEEAASPSAPTFNITAHAPGGVVVHQHIELQQQINVFGGENISHIGHSQIKELLDQTLTSTVADVSQKALEALLKTAMLIYSDPDHPENVTCYLPNKKWGEAMVHVQRNGGWQWEIQPCQLVLPPMTSAALDVLFVKQPFEDADRYGDVLKALRANEKAYLAGQALRPVLVKNKDLLQQMLGSLPRRAEGRRDEAEGRRDEAEGPGTP